jgi:hypothetical protein
LHEDRIYISFSDLDATIGSDDATIFDWAINNFDADVNSGGIESVV